MLTSDTATFATTLARRSAPSNGNGNGNGNDDSGQPPPPPSQPPTAAPAALPPTAAAAAAAAADDDDDEDVWPPPPPPPSPPQRQQVASSLSTSTSPRAAQGTRVLTRAPHTPWRHSTFLHDHVRDLLPRSVFDPLCVNQLHSFITVVKDVKGEMGTRPKQVARGRGGGEVGAPL